MPKEPRFTDLAKRFHETKDTDPIKHKAYIKLIMLLAKTFKFNFNIDFKYNARYGHAEILDDNRSPFGSITIERFSESKIDL